MKVVEREATRELLLLFTRCPTMHGNSASMDIRAAGRISRFWEAVGRPATALLDALTCHDTPASVIADMTKDLSEAARRALEAAPHD